MIGRREDVAQQHQDDRGGDDLAERAGGADHAAGEARIVALEHGRQGEQAHGDHGRADDAGGGRQQHADQGHREAESAAQGTEQAGHGIEQVFRHPRTLQHHSHKDKERHRDQDLVGHDPEEPVGRLQEGRSKKPAAAEQGESQGGAGEREGHREAQQQHAAGGANRARLRMSPCTGQTAV